MNTTGNFEPFVSVMDCGGKRSATPLSPAPRHTNVHQSSFARKLCRRCALPEQSKTSRQFVTGRIGFSAWKLGSFSGAWMLVLDATSSFAQGTAFTYQGRLNDGAAAAHGTYDFRFKLFQDSFGNTQAGGTVLMTAWP